LALWHLYKDISNGKKFWAEMKKTILYIIDVLDGMGGAELMLIAPLKEIHQEYNIILVTLEPGNSFEKDYFIGDKQYCLEMHSKIDIFKAAKKLKEIIKENNVDLVHSFLYWSVLVARLACGKKTTHIFSLATIMSQLIYKSKWYSGYTQLLDRITYKKNQVIISPTKEVLMDFDKFIGIKGRSEVIHNFVLDVFFENQIQYQSTSDELKLVAVGNIKEVKNYQVIIDAFQLLPDLPITLDIYGLGELTANQQKQIKEKNLSINVMGASDHIHEMLPKYDAFIMSSFLEGFGIATAEAMAIGLPLILSDIATLKEVSQGNALFFDPHTAKSLAEAIKSIMANKEKVKNFSEKGKMIALQNYTKEKYVNRLLQLYSEVLENKQSSFMK
jgi:L-malate glycosyltransferase